MNARKFKVLVVDDNLQNRLPIVETLETEGYEVIQATDGAAAVAAFSAHSPDCILMDVRMPKLDGFGATQQIRALPGGREVPIIFVTAQRDLVTFDSAQRAGANDFLTKPINLSELVTRVNMALRLRQMSAELRETCSLLRAQRDELMRLQLQKEQLTSFVVHDLKNPVSSIDMLAQFLLRDSSLSPTSRKVVQQIRGSGRTMLRLIMNLLDISRSEEGQLSLQKITIDSADLAREVTESLSAQAESYGVELQSIIEAPTLWADRELVRRFLENLVENAIRHAPRGTPVCILLTRVPGAVEVRVADSGPGIPAALRDKIFGKFVQLEQDGRHASNTNRGLGLTFCKVVVDAHGGALSIEDAAPGAIFCARFPDA